MKTTTRNHNLQTQAMVPPCAGDSDKPTPMRRARPFRPVTAIALSEEGGSMVELALVLPMLLLIVTGIFTFGITLNNYLMLTESVSTGSRLLAISRGQTTDPCATAAGAIYAAAPYLSKTSFTFTFVLNGTTYSGSSCSSGSTTTGAAGNLVQGASAQVTVSYPCSLKVYGYNYAPTCSLSAQTTELVQ